jgi:hypothetical protein
VRRSRSSWSPASTNFASTRACSVSRSTFESAPVTSASGKNPNRRASAAASSRAFDTDDGNDANGEGDALG